MKKLYPNEELAKSELLKVVPLGSSFKDFDEVLLKSKAKRLIYAPIGEIAQWDLVHYKPQNEETNKPDVHHDHGAKAFILTKDAKSIIFRRFDLNGQSGKRLIRRIAINYQIDTAVPTRDGDLKSFANQGRL